MRDDGRQHRIVENAGELIGDIGDRHEHADLKDRQAAAIRPCEPQQRSRRSNQKCEHGDPGLAPAAGIGDGADEGRQQGDHEPAIALDIAPQGLATHGITDQNIGEIGREDVDRDEKDVGNAREVEQRPRQLPHRAGERVSRRRGTVGRTPPARKPAALGRDSGLRRIGNIGQRFVCVDLIIGFSHPASLPTHSSWRSSHRCRRHRFRRQRARNDRASQLPPAGPRPECGHGARHRRGSQPWLCP